MKHLTRKFELTLKDRLMEPSRFIQVVLGPRQVGKTSGVQSVLASHFKESEYAYHSGEENLFEKEWFKTQVQAALAGKKKVIVFDEIQKIDQWSDLVKLAWDNQKKSKVKMHWVLLGSSSLKLTQGLGDSLAGRFELIQAHHWSWAESKKAYGLSLQDFITAGGYPASYPLLKDRNRFKKYLFESIFEAVVSKDILRYATVKKPALFRQVFSLICQYPAQEISYNKLLGQLQDAGNVDQIKYYLDLYAQAFLVKLVFKYGGSPLSRTSSPKLLPLAPVFSSLFLQRELTLEEKGRIFESIVGHRLNEEFSTLRYWREGSSEVDYVVESDFGVIGIEVKSARRKTSGLQAFRLKFPKAKTCIIDMNHYELFEKDPEGFLKEFSY